MLVYLCIVSSQSISQVNTQVSCDVLPLMLQCTVRYTVEANGWRTLDLASPAQVEPGLSSGRRANKKKYVGLSFPVE
jgi:hypothetical protein